MSCTSTQQTKCSIKTFLQTSKIREGFVLINGDYVKYVKPYIFLKEIAGHGKFVSVLHLKWKK